MTGLSCSTFREYKDCCLCVGLSNYSKEMDGCLTTEEAAKPVGRSFCFAFWKSLTALIPVLGGYFCGSAV